MSALGTTTRVATTPAAGDGDALGVTAGSVPVAEPLDECVGVAVGLAAATSPAVNAVVRPIVRVLAPLPKVALYPAMVLILGFDEPAARGGDAKRDADDERNRKASEQPE